MRCLNSNESFSDLAVSTVAELIAADRDLHQPDLINDYGEPTGFCREFDQMRNDLESQLRAIQIRATQLRYRLRTWTLQGCPSVKVVKDMEARVQACLDAHEQLQIEHIDLRNKLSLAEVVNRLASLGQ